MAAESHSIIQVAKEFAGGLPEGTNIFIIVFTWVSGFLYLRAKRSKTNLGEATDSAQVAQIKSLQEERDTAVKDSRESWQARLQASERMGVLQAESAAYRLRAETAETALKDLSTSLGRARRDRAVAEGRLKDALTLAKQLLPPEGYDLVVLKIYEVSDLPIAKELTYDDRATDITGSAIAAPAKRSPLKRLTDSVLGRGLDDPSSDDGG